MKHKFIVLWLSDKTSGKYNKVLPCAVKTKRTRKCYIDINQSYDTAHIQKLESN